MSSRVSNWRRAAGEAPPHPVRCVPCGADLVYDADRQPYCPVCQRRRDGAEMWPPRAVCAWLAILLGVVVGGCASPSEPTSLNGADHLQVRAANITESHGQARATFSYWAPALADEHLSLVVQTADGQTLRWHRVDLKTATPQAWRAAPSWTSTDPDYLPSQGATFHIVHHQCSPEPGCPHITPLQTWPAHLMEAR